MREIKFRAWEKFNKAMSYNVQNGIYDDPDETIPFEDVLELDRYTTMQYTGLKDKDGIEIYEGDIINDIDYGIMQCVFLHGSFVFHSVEDKLRWIDLQRYVPAIEVIGNIYENPELSPQEE